MRPNELARHTGVSTDTLRHYERLGLLPPVARTPAGYRTYPETAIGRVRMIRRALLVGFSLGELSAILAVRKRGGAPCRRVRAMAGGHLQGLTARIAELQALREDLETVLREWDAALAQTSAGQCANLLESLGARPGLAAHRAPGLRPASAG
jgi:DNA-binding transcriptional MerR regulator